MILKVQYCHFTNYQIKCSSNTNDFLDLLLQRTKLTNGSQMLLFWIYPQVHSKVTFPTDCSKSMTEHSMGTNAVQLLVNKASLIDDYGSRTLYQADQTFLRLCCSLILFLPNYSSSPISFRSVRTVLYSEGSPHLLFCPFCYELNCILP